MPIEPRMKFWYKKNFKFDIELHDNNALNKDRSKAIDYRKSVCDRRLQCLQWPPNENCSVVFLYYFVF